MQTLVIYDIADDRVRMRLAEACKDYGLQRIQYSAFLGDLNQARRRELLLRLERTLGDCDGNIRAYPICDKDLKLATEIRVGSFEPDDEDGAGDHVQSSFPVAVYRIKRGRR